MYEDVGRFHEKFGLPCADGAGVPAPLAGDVVAFRGAFMVEELAEWFEGQGDGLAEVAHRLRCIVDDLKAMGPSLPTAPLERLPGSADALADLVYVALGTAHMMRLPFGDVWAEVQRANMAKERATGASDGRSKRGHGLDVVKPEGWRAPDHWPAIYRAAVGP